VKASQSVLNLLAEEEAKQPGMPSSMAQMPIGLFDYTERLAPSPDSTVKGNFECASLLMF
jgi:hypothetical protein